METVLVIMTVVNAVLLVILAYTYYDQAKKSDELSKQALEYVKSFISMAAQADMLATQADSIKADVELNTEELQIIRSILTIHSEALNVNSLKALFREVDKLRQVSTNEDNPLSS